MQIFLFKRVWSTLPTSMSSDHSSCHISPHLWYLIPLSESLARCFWFRRLCQMKHEFATWLPSHLIPWHGKIAVLFVGTRRPFLTHGPHEAVVYFAIASWVLSMVRSANSSSPCRYMGACISCVELGLPFPTHMKRFVSSHWVNLASDIYCQWWTWPRWTCVGYWLMEVSHDHYIMRDAWHREYAFRWNYCLTE